MKKEIFDMCKILINVLEELKDEGKISAEQYEQHIKLKLDFLEIYSNSFKT